MSSLGIIILMPLLAAIAVRGTPAEVARQVGLRYGEHAERIGVYLPYGASDELMGELLDSLHRL